MTRKDYHRILGVSKDADEKELKKAFRKLALQYHPDRNRSPQAEERFKEISEAYAVLSGKEKAPRTQFERETRHHEREDAQWAYHVMSIWQGMEKESNNNMYR